MIKENKKISYNNKGSAIITALVVGTVLMVLTLSLLAISYQLFLSSKTNTSDINFRELFYSGIETLEAELMNSNEGSLGNDLIDKIEKKEWNQNTDKYFNLDTIGSVKLITRVYWKSINENGNDITILHAEYTLYKNDISKQIKDMEILMQNERMYKLEGSSGNSNTEYTIYDLSTPDNTEKVLLKFNNRGEITYIIINSGDKVTSNIPQLPEGAKWMIHDKNNNGASAKKWHDFCNSDGTESLNSFFESYMVYAIYPSDHNGNSENIKLENIMGHEENNTISMESLPQTNVPYKWVRMISK